MLGTPPIRNVCSDETPSLVLAWVREFDNPQTYKHVTFARQTPPRDEKCHTRLLRVSKTCPSLSHDSRRHGVFDLPCDVGTSSECNALFRLLFLGGANACESNTHPLCSLLLTPQGLTGTDDKDSGLPGAETTAETSAMDSITTDIDEMVFFNVDKEIFMMRHPNPLASFANITKGTTCHNVPTHSIRLELNTDIARFFPQLRTKAVPCFPVKTKRLSVSASLGNFGAKHV